MLQRLVTSMVQNECSGTPNRKKPSLTAADIGTRWRGRGTGRWSSLSTDRSAVRSSLRRRASMLARLAVAAERIKIDSAAVALSDRGAGEPVIVVHGLLSDGKAVAAAVGTLGGRFRVVAPDLPGFGRSDKPRGDLYSPPGLGAFVGRLRRPPRRSRAAQCGAG